MSNEQLWAPWRIGYITAPKDAKPAKCFLCACRDGSDDRANLVVARGEHTIVVLNRFPYNNGHVLISPREHRSELEDLAPDVLQECMLQMQRVIRALKRLMNPEGFNAGLNLGAVAGAGVPGHLHWHVVPRWKGDTSFMPVLAGATVIPQSLEALYEALAPEMRQ